MKQRIAVGIHADSSYSAQVLEQLGIASLPIDSIREGVSQGVRVFLSSGVCGQGGPEVAHGERIAIITDNGAVACGAQSKGKVINRSYYFQLGRESRFAARSFYANLPVLPTGEKCVGACYDRDNKEIPNSGIGLRERDNCLIVSLPWDIGGYEQGVEWESRPYFSRPARRHFVEVGPMLDAGAFRGLLLEILLLCFNRVGLPLIRVSPLHENKKYFSFRVDADGFTEASTEAALRVAEKSGLRFTWFLDMGCWKKKKKWIERLLEHNQDVQFHCFRHMTYASHKVNEINIRKGLEVMRRNGLTPNAIASPFGYNYRGFSEAIKKHGFAFSSEFGYAVDDLPSYPWNDRSYPLQIPVHPACSGILSQAGFSQAEQFDHMFDVVERRCRADGICILYDHPIGGLEAHETRYIEFFSQLSGGYKYICLSDYYRAWLKRPTCHAILFDQGRIEVDRFQDCGFRLEQVTNQEVGPVQWENRPLPQVRLLGGSDEFRYPPEWIRELARVKMLSNSKERNFSEFAWYANEIYDTLGRYTGYSWCRQRLALRRRLRAVREGVIQIGNRAQSLLGLKGKGEDART